ncbi:hypothetical protein [Stenotrophomonas oahuensis]|uniref:Transmembrane protein n=1 Tax=Stenotrophomonas oahuensis TaxID=3003271 RepID=A0ABY9YMJ0_9GAMM|nr:hypothetical protein [Stenotrophomonas sp. A5586]WNH52099.1 hypothetical protein PDM29_17425 [Stenotrophomonas sp. A5586]
MDMQVADSAPQLTQERQFDLTFSWLYEQVQAYTSTSIYPKATRLERWSLWLGLVATGAGLTVAALPAVIEPGLWMMKALRLCLAIEIGGFVLSFVLMLSREGQQYIKPRLTHAIEMDDAFRHWQSMVERVREYPKDEREHRLRFVNRLRVNMTDRMGLMYGGLQKLGPFPVLIAFYLQFRNWKWGDWAGAFDVNLVSGILMFALVLLYVMGWVFIGIKVRLDTYANLLEASLAEATEGRE